MKAIDGNTPSRLPEVVTRFMNPVAGEVTAVEPLSNQKNALAAFFAGVVFGPIGIGLYLKSWRAFLISAGLFVVLLLMLLPTGPGELLDFPLDWIFSAIYGAYVVATANSGERKGGMQ
jgi:hypothetical protein